MERVKHLSSRLAQFEIWVVAAIVLVSMFWPRFLPAAVAVAAFFWLARWIAFGSPSIRTSGDWPILLMCLLLPVSLWVTTQPEITRLQIYRLLTGMSLYYAVANWGRSSRSSIHLRISLAGLSAGALLLSISAPFIVDWSIGKLFLIPNTLYQRFSLVVSDTVHPNVLAGSLVILLPLPLALIVFGWRKIGPFERLLYLCTALILSSVIILTKSRGAWLALGAVLAGVTVLRWRYGWMLVPLMVALVTLTIVQVGTAPIIDYILSGPVSSSVGDRVEIWARATQLIHSFPYTGIGMGSFQKVADLLYPFPANAQEVVHAHNLFLQIALDLGIPGLIAWLGILLTMVATSWSVYYHGFRLKDLLTEGIGAGLLCSQAALLTHGITDAVTWGVVRPAPLVWAVWGIAVAAWYTQVDRADRLSATTG